MADNGCRGCIICCWGYIYLVFYRHRVVCSVFYRWIIIWILVNGWTGICVTSSDVTSSDWRKKIFCCFSKIVDSCLPYNYITERVTYARFCMHIMYNWNKLEQFVALLWDVECWLRFLSDFDVRIFFFSMAVSYIWFSLGWWNCIARKEIYRQLKIIEWDKFG